MPGNFYRPLPYPHPQQPRHDTWLETLRPYPDEVVADNPSVYYRMGEASGNIVDTMVGNDGTPTGSPTYGEVNGQLATDDGGVAFATDGSDYFTVTDSVDVENADASMSWEFWFRRDTDPSIQVTILQKGSGSYSIGIRSTDKLFIGKVGFAILVEESGTTPADGTWHHFVITRTGTGAGNTLIYKDGVEGHTDVSPANALVDNSSPLEIGRETSTGPGGALDEIAIYKAILPAGRVVAHFNARLIPPAPAAGSISVTPDAAALVLASFAPVVTATNHQLVTPGTASLVLTGLAPKLDLKVTPATATLTLATFAPTVTTTNHVTVVPGTATLTLTGFAPKLDLTVTPGVAALTLAGFAPVVTASDHKTVVPATATLTLTGFAPGVVGGAGLTVVPGTATLTLTGFAPSVALSDHKLVTPGVAALLLAAFAPTVTTSDHKVVTPAAAALLLSTFAPTVAIGAGSVTVIPGTAHLILTTFAPDINEATVIGGYPPGGSAWNPIAGGRAAAHRPGGSAPVLVPAGSASSPKPGR